MKRRIECQGQSYLLTTNRDEYSIVSEQDDGAAESGSASVIETGPGKYAVLFADGESVPVDVISAGANLEVLAGGSRYALALSDPRDRRANARNASANGPVEVRSQMPGKIIKVLVKEGQAIEEGGGLLVIEAMKMQNETKSPKTGIVERVHATEGAAVSAGALLLVVV